MSFAAWWLGKRQAAPGFTALAPGMFPGDWSGISPGKFWQCVRIGWRGIYKFLPLTKTLFMYIIGKSWNVNTMMRRVGCGTFQREIHLLEVSYWETSENCLGVTLIRSGLIPLSSNREALSSLKMKKQAGWNRESENTRPLQCNYCKGFFMQ